jgi:DNA-binding transcriptional ArsR family regulator
VSEREAKKELQAVDAVFGALDHPTRRQILLVMHFRGGEMTAGQIVERFSCRWPTITRHLKVLEQAGLLKVQKQGRERLYRIVRERLDVARQWFTWLEH